MTDVLPGFQGAHSQIKYIIYNSLYSTATAPQLVQFNGAPTIYLALIQYDAWMSRMTQAWAKFPKITFISCSSLNMDQERDSRVGTLCQRRRHPISGHLISLHSDHKRCIVPNLHSQPNLPDKEEVQMSFPRYQI